uniref:Uncharacterized protein n=2 Tax=Rhinopithecus TaxID=542827 RepID=A0A2K6LQW1_RHIBE
MLIYFMCGSRQFFFQCGPGKPKDWAPSPSRWLRTIDSEIGQESLTSPLK